MISLGNLHTSNGSMNNLYSNVHLINKKAHQNNSVRIEGKVVVELWCYPTLQPKQSGKL